jgi:hypothetical protein
MESGKRVSVSEFVSNFSPSDFGFLLGVIQRRFLVVLAILLVDE